MVYGTSFKGLALISPIDDAVRPRVSRRSAKVPVGYAFAAVLEQSLEKRMKLLYGVIAPFAHLVQLSYTSLASLPQI